MMGNQKNSTESQIKDISLLLKKDMFLIENIRKRR